MIDRNHPAVEAAMKSTAVDTLHILRPDAMGWRKRVAHLFSGMLTTALPHLTADDLPARLVRDIQVRTIRDAAHAATHEEDDIPWGHEWHRDGVAAWLDGLADNIEGETE